MIAGLRLRHQGSGPGPVAHPVFKTGGARQTALEGSTPSPFRAGDCFERWLTRRMTRSRGVLDHAPLDDEPESDEERQAVPSSRADRERGIKPVPLEVVLEELGRVL